MNSKQDKVNKIEDFKVFALWSALGYFIFDAATQAVVSMTGLDYKVTAIALIVGIFASAKYGFLDSLFGNGL